MTKKVKAEGDLAGCPKSWRLAVLLWRFVLWLLLFDGHVELQRGTFS